jgi:hypothetical protein
MKKIFYIILALGLGFVPAACSLDETSYTEVEKSEYLNNAEEANTVLLGIYRNMTLDGMYGYHLSLYFTLPTDIAKCEGSSITNFRNVPNNAYTATEDEVQTTWAALYNSIYQCNDFIERLSTKIDGYDDSEKNLAAVYMAEARALRGLFYFELVRWYGHIALVTTTDESMQDNDKYVQAEPAEVYEFIEADLKYAVDNLPYAADDTLRTSNDYRFSKGGALGLLTKVYATWAGYPVHDTSKWELAAQTAKTLVESGKHGLLADYEQLWKNSGESVWDATESLIEVSFYSATISGNKTQDASGRIGKWNGVAAVEGALSTGRVAANWKVVPTFAANWKDFEYDKRWSLSIADYRYTSSGKTALVTTTNSDGTKTDISLADAINADEDHVSSYRRGFNNTLCPKKWDMALYATTNQVTDANYSNVNWYILRYADVLLLYAEALNEVNQGPTDAAYEAVNMVRRRGFGLDITTASSLADLSEGMSYEEFQQAVRDERKYELAFEGERRQDLIRWGIYYQTIMDTYNGLSEWHADAQNYYLAAQYTKENKNELLPIPQREIDMLPNFTQNPGWE